MDAMEKYNYMKGKHEPRNYHSCKFEGGRSHQQGLSHLEIRIYEIYDNDDDNCCDDHSDMRIKVNFCPVCGFQNPYPGE